MGRKKLLNVDANHDERSTPLEQLWTQLNEYHHFVH